MKLEISTLLQRSYREVVGEISECNAKYDMLIAIYELRGLLGIPMLLLKPKLEFKGTRNKPRDWSVKNLAFLTSLIPNCQKMVLLSLPQMG